MTKGHYGEINEEQGIRKVGREERKVGNEEPKNQGGRSERTKKSLKKEHNEGRKEGSRNKEQRNGGKEGAK